MFCSRCGSEVAGKSRFCPSCGLDLTAGTPLETAATGAAADLEVVRDALAGEYEVLEELGRGGMALVYRAVDRQLEREIALKVLPFTLAFDGEFVERFQREARTAAQLEHPSIIPIYRVGRAGRVIYFVMKYLRGGSLSGVLQERTRLTPPEIRRLLIEAGSALAYAGQRGVVHRDIKPDNIMFDEHGHAVLTDFGIAKAVSGQKLTGTGMSIGTPHYMSPEQARAQPLDVRSDVYSLGVVAFKSLTGAVPYDGEDSFAIGYKHITEPIPTPALQSADERQLFEVIRRMLMKNPQERFQTPEEMIAALQGQAIALPGVPFTAGAAGVATGAPAVPGALPPLPITSQPTTPITSPVVDRRTMPDERRARARRLSDRGYVRRELLRSPAMMWLLLAIIGGGAGALYYYSVRGFASARSASDQLAAEEPATLRDTVAGAPVIAPPPVFVTPGDSGDVRIVGALPSGTTFYINDRHMEGPITRVPAGRHVVGIWAPGYDFWADTLDVVPGRLHEITPRLRLPSAEPT
jgi:serine/threonine protein kinase